MKQGIECIYRYQLYYSTRTHIILVLNTYTQAKPLAVQSNTPGMGSEHRLPAGCWHLMPPMHRFNLSVDGSRKSHFAYMLSLLNLITTDCSKVPTIRTYRKYSLQLCQGTLIFS